MSSSPDPENDKRFRVVRPELQCELDHKLSDEKRQYGGKGDSLSVMQTEFDAIEGRLVKRGIDRRDAFILTLSGAFTVCGCLAIFLWLVRPSHILFVLFLLAPLLIWSSVVTVCRIARDIIVFALPLAILISLFWVYVLLFGNRPGV
jgi:hypothetical protein